MAPFLVANSRRDISLHITKDNCTRATHIRGKPHVPKKGVISDLSVTRARCLTLSTQPISNNNLLIHKQTMLNANAPSFTLKQKFVNACFLGPRRNMLTQMLIFLFRVNRHIFLQMILRLIRTFASQSAWDTLENVSFCPGSNVSIPSTNDPVPFGVEYTFPTNIVLDPDIAGLYDLTGTDYYHVICLTCIAFSADLSIFIVYHLFVHNVTSTHEEPFSVLTNLKLRNVNRILCAQININSIRNKFDQLKSMISGKIDILAITETELNDSFPEAQFFLEGYTMPYRLDCSEDGGGIMIFVREEIPSRSIDPSPLTNGTESPFIEINLGNRKWFFSGIYIPHKNLVPIHLEKNGHTLDLYLKKYDNFLLMGDFNAEISEATMQIFCDSFNFNNLVKFPTCYKNPNNPSCIDLILRNKANSFCNTLAVETGLS